VDELNLEHLLAAIEEQLRQQPFSGVIHVAYQGTPIFSHAYGLANRSDQMPNRLNTRFGIASGGKIFTATAICQLAAARYLELGQTLVEIIPDLLPKLDRRVTISHLLTHTSGIPDYFDEETETDYETCWREVPVYQMRSALDFIPLIRDKEMKYTPGERFGYSNMGYVLLGLVIEKVTGKRFQEYVEERIFGPAWMRASGYFSGDCLPAHCATGYMIAADSSWRSNIFSIPVVGHGDGGVYTTAADIGRFWKALFARTYFDNDMLTRMTSAHVEVKPGSSQHYGYGFWIDEIGGHPCFSIVGEDPGVDFSSNYYPDLNLQITLLSNTNGALWPLEKVIRDEIFGLLPE
jgi:CubicO group peptidase (beta-lactamase class C family)